jgi:hypothetical protein
VEWIDGVFNLSYLELLSVKSVFELLIGIEPNELIWTVYRCILGVGINPGS